MENHPRKKRLFEMLSLLEGDQPDSVNSAFMHILSLLDECGLETITATDVLSAHEYREIAPLIYENLIKKARGIIAFKNFGGQLRQLAMNKNVLR